MQGRWAVTRRLSCKSSGDDWHIAVGPDPGDSSSGVPVVPCDDAAIDRVRKALADASGYASAAGDLQWLAERVLRAAGETP